MSDEELIPFAESLGIVTRGAELDLTLGQERLLRNLYADRPPEQVEPWQLELALVQTRRHWAHVHAIAVAMLQGIEVTIAPGMPRGELRRFFQDVRDELELAGRTFGTDVRPAIERLSSVALSASPHHRP